MIQNDSMIQNESFRNSHSTLGKIFISIGKVARRGPYRGRMARKGPFQKCTLYPSSPSHSPETRYNKVTKYIIKFSYLHGKSQITHKS